VITGEDKTLHLDQRVITVRMLGDIAVANGTYVLHHKAGSGPEVDEKGVFTHVFERAHGGWLCINSQRTVLREDSNAKPKKQSNAELPFHIPLFTKSDKSQIRIISRTAATPHADGHKRPEAQCGPGRESQLREV
jgi:hypothetical protein